MAITGTGSGTVTGTGINCLGDCTETVAHNTMIALTATPGVGSTFTSWSGGGCSGNGTCTVTMDALKTVTATFTINTYTVIPFAGANGTISPSTNVTVNHGATTSFTVTPNAGYTASVTGSCGGSLMGNTFTTNPITASCSVNASFTLNTFTLTVNPAGTGFGSVSSAPAGITCPGDCNEIYGSGTMVTLTAAPSVGSTFTSWTGGGCSGNGTCTVTMDALKMVTATFTINTYTVIPFAGPNGSISPSTNVTVNHGATTSFTLTPSAGYAASVTGSCGGTLLGNTFTTSPITARCSVNATFTQITYAVTPNAGANGVISPNSAQTIAQGATTTFTVTANSD